MQTYPSDVVAYMRRAFVGYGPDLEKLNEHNQGLNINATRLVVPLLELLDALPDRLLVLTTAKQAMLIVAIAEIRRCADAWRAGKSDFSMVRMDALDLQHPVKVVFDLLKLCPDEAPLLHVTALAFITPAAWRDQLRLDLSSAHHALVSGEWKAATVLGGSLVEALLLWAVMHKVKPATFSAHSPYKLGHKKEDPVNWDYADFLSFARTTRLISGDTADIGDKVRNYRNLIHPGNSYRNQMTCDKGTALVTLGLCEKIASELQRLRGKR